MTALEVLRDALRRVALVREALIDGDTEFAADLLRDLELDVATALERLKRAA